MDHEIHCPNCDGDLVLNNEMKHVKLRGIDLCVYNEYYVCLKCKTEIASVEQAGKLQKEIWNSYIQCRDG